VFRQSGVPISWFAGAAFPDAAEPDGDTGPGEMVKVLGRCR